MSDFGGLVFVIGIFVLNYAANHLIREVETRKLQADLEQQVRKVGGRQIAIEEIESWTYKRYRQYKYEVRFQTEGHYPHFANCRVKSSFLTGIDVHWEYPLEFLIREQQNPLEPVDDKVVFNTYIYQDEPSKELLLNCLNSHYRHERRATIERIAEMPTVNDMLVAKIREIAEADPDREVVKAANDFLQNR